MEGGGWWGVGGEASGWLHCYAKAVGYANVLGGGGGARGEKEDGHRRLHNHLIGREGEGAGSYMNDSSSRHSNNDNNNIHNRIIIIIIINNNDQKINGFIVKEKEKKKKKKKKKNRNGHLSNWMQHFPETDENCLFLTHRPPVDGSGSAAAGTFPFPALVNKNNNS